MRITRSRCAACAGAGTVAKPHLIGSSQAMKARSVCIICDGEGVIVRRITEYEDRAAHMLRIRIADPRERSRRERIRLGIPTDCHRIYGIDVPDKFWMHVREEAYRLRHTLGASLEEVRFFIRDMIDRKNADFMEAERRRLLRQERAVAVRPFVSVKQLPAIRSETEDKPPPAPYISDFIRPLTKDRLMAGR